MRAESFSETIRERLGGETITFCYQCGTCASSCPVAKRTTDFNPREIIKLCLLDEKDEILDGKSIWLCCSCYNCQERCPQKVEIADVIYAVRNIAIEKGKVPNIYFEFFNAISNDGRIVKVSQFAENKRPQLGLPPLQPTGVDALKKILSTTGFDKFHLKKEEPQ
ncbi:MAG: 4Fe-4S dicluster domain-containing protein [Candidatus Bathyarchaeota archaeon]|nr:MAG: 4Fe-4S dicluster domain-containing protein [Candidatus Bathyarchaeota archaeon]